MPTGVEPMHRGGGPDEDRATPGTSQLHRVAFPADAGNATGNDHLCKGLSRRSRERPAISPLHQAPALAVAFILRMAYAGAGNLSTGERARSASEAVKIAIVLNEGGADHSERKIGRGCSHGGEITIPR